MRSNSHGRHFTAGIRLMTNDGGIKVPSPSARQSF